MQKTRKRALVLPSMLILLLFAAIPLVIMLVYSLRAHNETTLTFANYLNFFTKKVYLQLTWSTIWTSLLVTVISLVLSYPLAYMMAKRLKSGKFIIMALLIIPFFTNQLVRVYSWLVFLQTGGVLQSILQSLHLLDGPLNILYTRGATVIGLVHAFFPMMVITIYLALERIDDSLLDAASSLGGNKVTNFLRITFPLSLPGVISGITIVFVPCLGTFVEARILGGANSAMIGTVIEDQFISINNWEFGAAIAFILLILVLLSMAGLNALGRRYATK